MLDEENEVTDETVQKIDDNPNKNNKSAPETSASSESDEVVSIVPCSEPVQTVAQSHSSSETKCGVKNGLDEAKTDVNDSVSDIKPELGFDSESHQAACTNKEASDTTANSETRVTSQNQAYDEQKCKDKQTAELSDPAINKILGTEKDENTAEPGAGKQGKHEKISKYLANDESHQEETVCTGPDRKVLEAEAQTADTCQVTSVEEVLVEKRNSGDSTKEDLADKIVNEIHQEEAISTTSRPEPVQVQAGTEDEVQQASTTVKEEQGDESSTESEPEEDISAGITEHIAHEEISLKEKPDKLGSAGDSQEAASAGEKETLEAKTENASQETPVDKSTSSAQISQGDVLIAEREVSGAQSINEIEIGANIVEEELEARSGSEMLKAPINSANTHPVDVALTGKSEIKLTADSTMEKPDKNSNECKQEENCNSVQEIKSAKEGLGDKSHTKHNLLQATSADIAKEVLADKVSTENLCQEIKPATDELDDEKEEKLEDKSSVESTPEEALVQVSVKEILEAEATETSCQETKLVKDELDDIREAQLVDKSSVESIPEKASVQTAVQTQTNHETTNQEITSVKDELVDKVEVAIDDKSSTESYQAESNSMVGVKDVLVPVADADRTYPPLTSTKEEIDGTNSTKVEPSQQTTAIIQQVTDMVGTKKDPLPC